MVCGHSRFLSVGNESHPIAARKMGTRTNVRRRCSLMLAVWNLVIHRVQKSTTVRWLPGNRWLEPWEAIAGWSESGPPSWMADRFWWTGAVTSYRRLYPFCASCAVGSFGNNRCPGSHLRAVRETVLSLPGKRRARLIFFICLFGFLWK